MNFVVLKNVGTDECQIWQKFNLNVRVSCECFVGLSSFSFVFKHHFLVSFRKLLENSLQSDRVIVKRSCSYKRSPNQVSLE